MIPCGRYVHNSNLGSRCVSYCGTVSYIVLEYIRVWILGNCDGQGSRINDMQRSDILAECGVDILRGLGLYVKLL